MKFTAFERTLQGTGALRTYVPNPGAVGQDAYTFRANDGRASSDPATVSITITPPTPVNRPPIAVSQTVYLAQGARADLGSSGP